MSKDKDHGNHIREQRIRAACACICILIFMVLLIILIVYLVLRPSKPKFYIQDTTVIQFNLSSSNSTPPNLLTSQIQITISSRNPNDRVGIYYDRLDVYASYQSQQITLPTQIPPLYQGHNDVNVWSPYVQGAGIPIAPYLGQALTEDEADGYFFLFVKIDGRIRWKVGTWTSGHYHLFVNCPAYLSFNRSPARSAGESKVAGPVIRFQQISTCSVDI